MPAPGTFLPVNRDDMAARGWDACDFVMVSGAAYVDHPSFGAAVISRYLESLGYRVGVLAQPAWRQPGSMSALGRPRLAFLATAGNLDSMVNRYTANRKPRSEDVFSPGGQAGLRPDRALIAYCNAIKRDFPGVPIVLGGLEASLRRLSHYDYWSDSLRKSVLLDSKADLLVYGMGERAIAAIASGLAEGVGIKTLRDIPGTVWRTGRDKDIPQEALRLPSHEEQAEDKAAFAQAFALQYRNTDPASASVLAEPSAAGWCVQNPPAAPLSREELDRIYALPYVRDSHPMYAAAGGVPALAEVRFSITVTRGCFGACSFCALALHQGRRVVSRSLESVEAEAILLTRLPGFKGIIHDLGGPTANFLSPPCPGQEKKGACPDRRCLAPLPCPALKPDHTEWLRMLRAVRAIPGVKRAFVRSGLRFDYLMLDRNAPAILEELCLHHVSGQLKIAPEHVSEKVLRAMGKPGSDIFRAFRAAFREASLQAGKELHLIPYYISAHPGSTLEDAIELALALKAEGHAPDQIQDFYPVPGTLSTAMYYCGFDPLNGETLHIPRGERERRLQRALLHFHKPENEALVREALRAAGRADLIGKDSGCLVRP